MYCVNQCCIVINPIKKVMSCVIGKCMHIKAGPMINDDNEYYKSVLA